MIACRWCLLQLSACKAAPDSTAPPGNAPCTASGAKLCHHLAKLRCKPVIAMPIKHYLPHLARLLAALLLLAAVAVYAADESSAEDAPGKPPVQVEPTTSARALLENEKIADELAQQRSLGGAPEQALESGRTPLATILALRQAFAAKDYESAATYLDMRYIDTDLEGNTPAQLARALTYMVAQQLVLDISSLSDDPQGHQQDGLPPYRDLLATVALSDGEVPIYLQRVPDGSGGYMWKISNASVEQIPRMWEELGFHPLARKLFQVLPDFSFLGLLNWQVLGIILAVVAGWVASTLFTWAANRLVQHIPNIFPQGIEHFFRRPLRVFLFIIITVGLIQHLGLSLKMRIMLNSSGLDYLAYTILLLGFISLVRDYNIRRLQALGQNNFAALLRPMTAMLKVVLVTIVALVWAANAGYNISTLLAGLGVGSVAVALAAQKTLENLIGAITLYAARPVSPGDVCRFGNLTGTVEEIGLRSTTIRTLDRTLVHVPNAIFSSAEIENYSARDRIRFFRNTHLLAQSPDQLRVVLANIRQTLYSHPMVYPDTVSVRLEDINDVAAKLRLDAGIRTTHFQEFLAVAEDLNLRFIQIVLDAGASICGPGQLRIVRDGQPHDGDNAYIRDMLALWKEQDSKPFPDFSDQQIEAMSGSLDYPPK